MTVPPTVEDVRLWAQVPATSVSDELLGHVLAAELGIQAELCGVEPYTDALYQAALRRCARELAARGVPLGMTGDAELGTARLATFDAEVERLERTSRLGVLG